MQEMPLRNTRRAAQALPAPLLPSTAASLMLMVRPDGTHFECCSSSTVATSNKLLEAAMSVSHAAS